MADLDTLARGLAGHLDRLGVEWSAVAGMT
jgi:hypothetical protein